jgi:NAD(P)H-dependent flavin oxidoreductase YrpB (nitropropane dioxygenase family)
VDGSFRQALAQFPFPEVSERILAKYFVAGGIPEGAVCKSVSAFNFDSTRELIELAVAGAFCLVWISKKGHDGEVSINLLEKVQIPHIYYLTGAMLAGVDWVTMGAGITLQVPGVLDAIVSGGVPSYRVAVAGSVDGSVALSFNPSEFFGRMPAVKRPKFLPIVSTHVLASMMEKRLPAGSIQGFVVEFPIAGGHNAPPRGKSALSNIGEPVYGIRDEVNFSTLRDLGIPFWVAGGFASPEGLARAESLRAEGIQTGTIFALCEDSGMIPAFRAEIRRQGFRGELNVRTDPKASPTGFPFKVIQLAGTQSDPAVYAARKRTCDICFLRVPYQHAGGIGFRCPAEPIDDYLRKGGELADAANARCLCNGLLAGAGLATSGRELPIFTLGDDVSFLPHLMNNENDSYTSADAIAYLRSK